MAFEHLPTLTKAPKIIDDGSLTAGATLDQWQNEAGMNWTIQRAPAHYVPVIDGQPQTAQPVSNRDVLYRSDNGQSLSIMSGNRYKIVQPKEVLSFYRDLIEAAGGDYVLENAGALQNGRKLFALARHKHAETSELKAYLMLATSCDGSLSTVGKLLSFRPACLNVLQFKSDSDEIRIPHSRDFDQHQVKSELGVIEGSFTELTDTVRQLADTRVTDREAMDYFARLYGPEKTQSLDTELPEISDFSKGQKDTINKLMDNYFQGPGSQLQTAKGTAWGLVNAVTHYHDHQARTRGDRSNRFASATLGAGAQSKERGLSLAKCLAA